MDKSPDHKERALAWLRDLEEAVKTWRQPPYTNRVINARWTAKSVNDHYAMVPVSITTLSRMTSHISNLLYEMTATPDAITQDDIGALSELVRLRTNLNIVLNAKISKE